MTLWVKICGLSTAQDVDAAVSAGADAVGFVFHAASPRNVTPEVAAELAQVLLGDNQGDAEHQCGYGKEIHPRKVATHPPGWN